MAQTDVGRGRGSSVRARDRPSPANRQRDFPRAFTDTLALAKTHKLTLYDAAYLELAMRKGATLATKDVALARAAKSAGVPLL